MLPWINIHKEVSSHLFKALESGIYTHSEYVSAVRHCYVKLDCFLNESCFRDGGLFKDLPIEPDTDRVEDFIELVLVFHETLRLLDHHLSGGNPITVLSGDEIVPLELAFTSSGSFVESAWCGTSSVLSKAEPLYYSLASCSDPLGDKFVIHTSTYMQEIATTPEVRRFLVPLAPTTGLHKTVSNVLSDLVKSFCATKRVAHIPIHAGTYSGNEAFVSFLTNAKLGSAMVLFNEMSADECIAFLATEGYDSYELDKASSSKALQAVAFLKALSYEAVKSMILTAFYGKNPFWSGLSMDLETVPLYRNYGHLNRQYSGFTYNGKTTNTSVRFNVSLVASPDSVCPTYLMVAEAAVKPKTIGLDSSRATVPDLDVSVQSPPLRGRY